MTMTNSELEEKLREAACFGDIDGVKELLSKGVNVNSQHDINGWTALHWAAKRNHLNIVNLLCNHGADKSITTNKGETAASLTTEGVIRVLLMARKDGQILTNTPDKLPSKDGRQISTGKPLAIVPNYIRDPPLAYQVDIDGRGEKKPRMDMEENKFQRTNEDTKYQRKNEDFMRKPEQREVTVKVRVAGTEDPDFIEVDLPKAALTLEFLTVICCEELGITASRVERVRKLPNTRLRRDKDVTRLVDMQELEMVLKKDEDMVEEAEVENEAAKEVVEKVEGVETKENNENNVVEPMNSE